MNQEQPETPVFRGYRPYKGQGGTECKTRVSTGHYSFIAGNLKIDKNRKIFFRVCLFFLSIFNVFVGLLLIFKILTLKYTLGTVEQNTALHCVSPNQLSVRKMFVAKGSFNQCS